MSDTILYLVLGALVGATLAVVVLGALFWRQSSAQEPAQVSASSLPGGAQDNAIRVLPDYDGKWMVQLAGKSYYHMSQVSDPLTIQRLSRMLEALSGFAARTPEVAPPPPAAAAPLSLEIKPEAALPPTAGVAPAPPPGPKIEASVKPAPTAPPPKPPNFLRLELGRKSTVAPPPPVLSIAEQIDQVLQRRLETMPGVPPGGIRVGAAEDGSLRIEVAGQVYPGIDSVPHPGIRELLKAAVKEWESQA